MKLSSPKSLAVAFTLIFFIQSCTKEGPQGPAGPALTGTLYGFVGLEDQYGSKITTGLNNTTATLTVPTTGASMMATTDSNGRYSFANISTGQYTISFSAPGFGSIANTPVGFLGGGNIDHDAKMSAIPNFTDSLLTLSDTLGNIVLNGTFSGTDTRKRTVAVFVGSTNSVSFVPANYLLNYTGTANANLTTFTVKIPLGDLSDAGFINGSTVYFAVYGAATNYASTSDYEDYTNTGRTWYTALSPGANTASFVSLKTG